jgi:hemerythrin-like domain-containing protein
MPHRDAGPLQELIREHEIIESVLDAVEATVRREEQSGDFVPFFYERALAFFSAFADRCHHEKEEKHLFPALERYGIPRAGGPIGCMLDEHEEGRLHIRSAVAALQGAEHGDRDSQRAVRSEAMAYARLLRQHIEKENQVLFVAAERVLPPDVLGDIEEEFAKSELVVGGAEGHERLVAIARELVASAGTGQAAAVEGPQITDTCCYIPRHES